MEATVLIEPKSQVTTSKAIITTCKSEQTDKRTHPFGDDSSTELLLGTLPDDLLLLVWLELFPLPLSSSSFVLFAYSLPEPSLEKELLLFDAFGFSFCGVGM